MEASEGKVLEPKYWAAKGIKELLPSLVSRTEDYYKFLELTGRIYLWRRSYEAYYRQSASLGKLEKTGEQAEFMKVRVNDYRNIALHLKSLTTQQRPAFDPRATNTDYKSMAQTILASGLLDYYNREKRMERHTVQGLEYGLIYDHSYVSCIWDANDGESYGKNELGIDVPEGDIKYESYPPIDVVVDPSDYNQGTESWKIVRSFRNRYDLMALYPELEDRIEGLPSVKELFDQYIINPCAFDDSDMIPVYRFYHPRTPSLPEGREVHYLSSDLGLIDGPLPYRTVPVFRFLPSKQDATPFGYTVMYDILPLQEAIDGLYSIAMTNNKTFGVQSIVGPKGGNLSYNELGKGLSYLEYDQSKGKVEALQLTQSSPELYNLIGMLEKKIETLSAVNSVARGQPEASLKSGAAIAFVQAMAVQFSKDLEGAWIRLLEDVATATIQTLQDFASVPRVAMIAGKANRPFMKEFTGDDLNLISRVMVDIGNPLTRTVAGKVNLADALMEKGFLKTPEQYIQVMTTGRLEPVIESDQAELMLVRAENERLSDSLPVQAMITDSHALHVREHKVVLASPEARENPEIVMAVTNHIQEHFDLLSTTNPQLLALLGEQSMQAPPSPEVGQGMDPGAAMNAQLPGDPNLPSAPAGTDPMTQGTIDEQNAILEGGQ